MTKTDGQVPVLAKDDRIQAAERNSGMTLGEARDYANARFHAWRLNAPDRIPKELRALRVVCAALDVAAPYRAKIAELEGALGPAGHRFQLGDRVCKIKGSAWHGRVVGFYSTSLTPIGYAVESEREPGSVQIYPEAALTPEAKGGAA